MVEFLFLPLILLVIKRRFPFFLDFNYPSYHCWIAMCFIRRLTPKLFVIIKWYGGNFCNFFCLWINYTKVLRSNSYMYKTNLYVFYKHTICFLSLLYFRKRESCDLILTRTGCLFSRFPPSSASSATGGVFLLALCILLLSETKIIFYYLHQQ